MRTINEIASWYKKNNLLAQNDLNRCKVLSIYTLVAYKIKNIEVQYEEMTYQNNDFNFGITNYEESAEFNEEETRILNTINRTYGYIPLEYLYSELSYAGQKIDEIVSFLRTDINEELEGNAYYDFNEYVLLGKNNVYFVNNNTNLTEEEKTRLIDKKSNDDQTLYTVFRDENDKLVVY